MAANAGDIQVQQVQQNPRHLAELEDILKLSRDVSVEPYFRNPYKAVVKPSPYQKQAQRMGSQTQQWLPFLQQSQQQLANVNPSYAQNYQQYMNPFESGAVNKVTQDVTRNFNENVLPGIEAHFIKRGQHGSSKARQMVNKATRDMNSELAGRLAQLRAYGYEMGGRQHESEQKRRMEMAELMSTLGRQAQASHIADVGMLQNIGQEEYQHRQDIADALRNEWAQSRRHPYEMLQMRHSIAQGLPFATSNVYESMGRPQQQVNRSGNLSSLALALLGARRRGMFGEE